MSVDRNTLCSSVGIKTPKTMPRVVQDQRSVFENDELFRKLSRECEVCVNSTYFGEFSKFFNSVQLSSYGMVHVTASLCECVLRKFHVRSLYLCVCHSVLSLCSIKKIPKILNIEL